MAFGGIDEKAYTRGYYEILTLMVMVLPHPDRKEGQDLNIFFNALDAGQKVNIILRNELEDIENPTRDRVNRALSNLGLFNQEVLSDHIPSDLEPIWSQAMGRSVALCQCYERLENISKTLVPEMRALVERPVHSLKGKIAEILPVALGISVNQKVPSIKPIIDVYNSFSKSHPASDTGFHIN